MNAVYVRVKRTLSRGFQVYGTAVGRHPVIFSVAPLIVFSLLSLGIFRLQKENDTEYLYTPVGSRIFRYRDVGRGSVTHARARVLLKRLGETFHCIVS